MMTNENSDKSIAEIGQSDLQVKHSKAEISGWMTDLASVDFYHHSSLPSSSSSSSSSFPHYPHTVFMLVVGNPGCIGWYLDMLHSIVRKLGRGYAARAVSYAGHGIGDQMIRIDNDNNNNIGFDVGIDKDRGRDNGEQVHLHLNNKSKMRKNEAKKRKKAYIAHTVDGQVEHKIEWVDYVLSEMLPIRKRATEATEATTSMTNQIHSQTQKQQQHKQQQDRKEIQFVFLTHSIGAHLVQRMMMLRRDILLQTRTIIHLMPFIRYDPSSWWTKNFLSTAANAPQQVITFLKALSRITSRLPHNVVDSYLKNIESIQRQSDRILARKLYSQPLYLRNFFELGAEEIREVPEIQDEAAMKVIGDICPTFILYCADDHWAEIRFLHSIKEAQSAKRLPENIHMECMEHLVHAFIVKPEMVTQVVDFVIRSVASVKTSSMVRKVMDEQKEIPIFQSKL